MPENYFGERVAARYDDPSDRIFNPAASSRRSTSSPSLAGDGAALELGIGTGRMSRCRCPARRPRARHRPVRGHGRPAAREAGWRAIGVTHRRLRHDAGRRDVRRRLPRLQHDQQPDHAGRAGRVLPQRRCAPGAGRLLRDRGRRPRASGCSRPARPSVPSPSPRPTSASTSTTSRPGTDLAPLRRPSTAARAPLGAVPLRLARRARPDGAAGRDVAARALERLDARAVHRARARSHVSVWEKANGASAGRGARPGRASGAAGARSRRRLVQRLGRPVVDPWAMSDEDVSARPGRAAAAASGASAGSSPPLVAGPVYARCRARRRRRAPAARATRARPLPAAAAPDRDHLERRARMPSNGTRWCGTSSASASAAQSRLCRSRSSITPAARERADPGLGALVRDRSKHPHAPVPVAKRVRAALHELASDEPADAEVRLVAERCPRPQLRRGRSPGLCSSARARSLVLAATVLVLQCTSCAPNADRTRGHGVLVHWSTSEGAATDLRGPTGGRRPDPEPDGAQLLDFRGGEAAAGGQWHRGDPVILGCGNFGGIGSSPAFFGQGTSKRSVPAAWTPPGTRGDHDVRHRGRVRRRAQRELHRRMARDEAADVRDRS